MIFKRLIRLIQLTRFTILIRLISITSIVSITLIILLMRVMLIICIRLIILLISIILVMLIMVFYPLAFGISATVLLTAIRKQLHWRLRKLNRKSRQNVGHMLQNILYKFIILQTHRLFIKRDWVEIFGFLIASVLVPLKWLFVLKSSKHRPETVQKPDKKCPQNTKKSSKHHSKTIQNQWTSMLGLVSGTLGNALGAIWVPKAVRLAQKKGTRWPTNERVRASMLGSIFDLFRFFSMFLYVLF